MNIQKYQNVIEISNVSKKFILYRHPRDRLFEIFTLRKKLRHEDLWVLKDINLKISKDTWLGVIGSNGAGKTTLLRLITRITVPTTGNIIIRGKVGVLLEIGLGFHPELSGLENAVILGALLGLEYDDREKFIQKIREFSELEDFFDRPLKTYSQGMILRLGFSVAVSHNPDILVVDETLAIGDEYFKDKCLDRINRFKENGITIVQVSHDLDFIRRFCTEVVVLDHGKIIFSGPPESSIDFYLEHVHKLKRDLLDSRQVKCLQWGSGEIRLHDFSLMDSNGTEKNLFQTGESVLVEFSFTCYKNVNKPVFGFGIQKLNGIFLSAQNHLYNEKPVIIKNLAAGDCGSVRISIINLPLLSGVYYLSFYCYDHSHALPKAIDHLEKNIRFEILEQTRATHGVVQLETEWSIHHSLNN